MYVTRWRSAGLLDESTAAAIRAFEQSHVRPRGRQWQVLSALILGGILLGAGVLLFVAAHWDTVSPVGRMLLVLSMLVFFHGFGWLAQERFAGLATAMHAIGTVSAGAAIALVGQIFNMQEHWPSAILLWAMCAAAGWLLLRDEFQQTITLLLVPAWIVAEWSYRTSAYGGSFVYIARIGAVIGAVYLTAFLHSRRRVVFGILFSAGAILLTISIGMLAEAGWNTGFNQQWGFVPVSYRMAALGILLLAGLFGAVSEKQSVVPVSIAAVAAYALPWVQRVVTEGYSGRAWQRAEPSLLSYLIIAAAAIAFVCWGVRISAKSLVNYGMEAFALTVIFFYFSNVMDKLGRSVGLILLGVLFLAGGWGLEQTRRRLVRGIAGDAV